MYSLDLLVTEDLTGEPCAVKAASTVRRGTFGKGLTRAPRWASTLPSRILLQDKRLVEMIQEQLDKEDYLMNSPFLQKVRNEERYEIAKNFKQVGIDVQIVQIIANATGLSVEEIEQL